jgi:hypothetical protein
MLDPSGQTGQSTMVLVTIAHIDPAAESGGKIASHNVGWSFTVLNTMASIPSSTAAVDRDWTVMACLRW